MLSYNSHHARVYRALLTAEVRDHVSIVTRLCNNVAACY